MSSFQPIGLNHKSLFDELRSYERTESSSDSFGNVFLWDILCRRNVARLGDRLGVEYLCPRGTFYAYPLGKGDLAGAAPSLSTASLSPSAGRWRRRSPAALTLKRTGTTSITSMPWTP